MLYELCIELHVSGCLCLPSRILYTIDSVHTHLHGKVYTDNKLLQDYAMKERREYECMRRVTRFERQLPYIPVNLFGDACIL